MIDHLDHLVLTTKDKQRCIAFYVDLLGMRCETFGEGRMAFKFGTQKINLHEYGKEFLPKANLPTPGSLDLCFIASVPLDSVIARLAENNWSIEEGPVTRIGAMYKIRSIYLRDPDGNLIEISERAD
ncbi:MAG: VOC family protein [Pseudomonadota bacterium]|nr:VOC family protein [Pseudomonadota bacterium]